MANEWRSCGEEEYPLVGHGGILCPPVHSCSDLLKVENARMACVQCVCVMCRGVWLFVDDMRACVHVGGWVFV